jgi:hypothetical protein
MEVIDNAIPTYGIYRVLFYYGTGIKGDYYWYLIFFDNKFRFN